MYRGSGSNSEEMATSGTNFNFQKVIEPFNEKDYNEDYILTNSILRYQLKHLDPSNYRKYPIYDKYEIDSFKDTLIDKYNSRYFPFELCFNTYRNFYKEEKMFMNFSQRMKKKEQQEDYYNNNYNNSNYKNKDKDYYKSLDIFKNKENYYKEKKKIKDIELSKEKEQEHEKDKEHDKDREKETEREGEGEGDGEDGEGEQEKSEHGDISDELKSEGDYNFDYNKSEDEFENEGTDEHII